MVLKIWHRPNDAHSSKDVALCCSDPKNHLSQVPQIEVSKQANMKI